jgi:hypothetical protein
MLPAADVLTETPCHTTALQVRHIAAALAVHVCTLLHQLLLLLLPVSMHWQAS